MVRFEEAQGGAVNSSPAAVSVVVPTHNRGASVVRLLHALGLSAVAEFPLASGRRADLVALYFVADPYLVSLCRDRMLAEDLMQETFIKATRALGGYRGGSPRAWLFAISRTVFLDHVRREARRPTVSDELDPPRVGESDVAEVDAIERALATLPERQRTALLLSDRVGLSGAEVAETLGISEGAARVLIHRARHTFRATYEAGSQ
mgnify:CR=1 FL=1